MNEKGRSMVEMLGVLAIIGVLSAGGLAGYSKAMFQHKANQTINTFSLVLQRYQELLHKSLPGEFTVNGTADIIKYGLLENCQETQINGLTRCKLPMGYLSIEADGQTFSVDFTSAKECVAFATAGWEKAIPVEWWGEMDIEGPSTYALYAPKYNVNKTGTSEIAEGCNEQCEDGMCGLYFYFERIL